MNIYFPLEGQARELNARIYFCIEAAKKGHKPYFGQKIDLEPLVPKLKPGIFFHKSAQLRKIDKIAKLKNLGHFNVSIDEEGLIRWNDEVYFGYRLSRRSLNLLDIFFSWGDEHTQKILNKYPEFSQKVFSAGHSRIDVLKINLENDKKVTYLKKKYGRFLLFAGKFGMCNGLNYNQFNNYADAQKYNLESLSDKGYQNILKNIDWERENMIGFMNAIKVCAQTFKDRKIIIRPHPIENLKTWYKFTDELNLDNIVIDSDGNSIIPWILASEKFISHNCTTSIESTFLGVKSINYIASSSKEFEYELPLLCSDTARNIEQLISLINQSKKDNILDKTKLEFYIKNCGKKTFYDYSMEIIESIVNPNDFSRKNKKYNFFFLIFKKFIKYLKINYSLYLGNYTHRRNLFKQKFKGFDLSQVKQIIKLYSSEDEVNASEPWPGVFLISQKSNKNK